MATVSRRQNWQPLSCSRNSALVAVVAVAVIVVVLLVVGTDIGAFVTKLLSW